MIESWDDEAWDDYILANARQKSWDALPLLPLERSVDAVSVD